VASPALVGRSVERARLADAVAAPPAVVVVEGEAGIGKTRLLSELPRHADLRGFRFAAGSCRNIRERFPLGAVIEAIRGLEEALRAATVSPVAGALRPLLPEVAHALPPLPDPLDDRAAELHRVFRALVEVLAAVGATVLILENLQWADSQTVDFLGYLVTDLPPQLSVVITYRGDEVGPDVRSLTSVVPASVTRAHVELAPLTEQEVATLATAIIGVDRLPEAFVRDVVEQTSGLPFAIEELLEPLRSGTGREHGPGDRGGWHGPVLEELPAPAGIRGPVLERVSHLDDDARSVVEGAAVLRVPVPMDVLAATTGMPPERTERAVEEALRAGVLVEHDRTVGYRHRLAAQAVYESVRGPRRERLHERAAAALHDRGSTVFDDEASQPGDDMSSDAVVRTKSLVLDTRTRDVHRGDRVLDLTRTEFRLLELFMRNARQVLTHELIFDRVWGFDVWPQSNTLRVYIGYLRHKTEAGGEPRIIHTVRGVGYVLRD
jgi:predicted ATPase